MRLPIKIKPKHGFSYFFHLGLLSLLPLLVFVLVRLHINQLALAIILLSKWRMFAVRPRHWLANIRANGIDILVGVAFLVLMSHGDSELWQLIWAAAYWVWLILIKPGSSALWVTVQAMLGQLLGLTALFLVYGDAPLLVLVAGAWVVAYGSARHFFGGFDEPMTPFLSYVWAYFAGALVWILGHWLAFYGPVSQPTLLLTVVGYGLGSLYYLHENDRLSTVVRRQIILVIIAIIVIVIAFSDWGDKIV